VSFDHETVHVFDLSTDPGETKNLAADMPPRASELLTALKAFVEGGGVAPVSGR
jgi:hypothetical protein